MKKLDIKEVYKRFLSKNIKCLENYVNNRTKIIVECMTCFHTWKVKPNDVFSGHGCPSCGDSIRYTNDEIDDKLSGSNIKRLGDYINCETKIDFQCKICNKIWAASTNCLFSKKVNSCPECSKGKAEKRVGELIKEYCQYDYIEPHKPLYFNNRKYIPDFYLLKNNKIIIIEYNGRQHYELVNWSKNLIKSKEKFAIQKQRDNEIRCYCKNNNIFLLEIPCWWKEYQIIEALVKFLGGDNIGECDKHIDECGIKSI